MKKTLFIFLTVIWVCYFCFELLVWMPALRSLVFSINPVVEIIANVLNDTIWIPIAFTLPLYLSALLTKVTKFTWIKIVFFLAGLCILALGVSNPEQFFKYLFYMIVPFFALFVYYITTFKTIRINILVYTLVLLALVLHYRSQLLPSFKPLYRKDTLKLMSYNILVSETGEKRRAVIDFIRREKPDVVFLQEINLQDRVLLKEELMDLYPHQIWSDKFETYNGGVIFSRLPLKFRKNYDIKTQYMSGHINMNHAIIDYYGQDVHLFNCHLYNSGNLFIRFAFGKMDYEAFKKQVTIAHNRHLTEAAKIAEQVLPVNAPLILAGDFNDTPNSRSYKTFKSTLNNAYAKAGWGIGGTFGYSSLVKSVPEKARFLLFDFLRIDHVFYSDQFNVCSAKVIKFDASDHRPQIIELRLKHPQKTD